MNNRIAIVGLLLLLVMPLSAYALSITNGDFQTHDNSQVMSNCADQLIFGCQQIGLDYMYPNSWITGTTDNNMWAGITHPTFTAASTLLGDREGYYGLEVFYEPPSNCSHVWNSTTKAVNGCNNTLDIAMPYYNIGLAGHATLANQGTTNTSFALKYYAKKCDYIEYKCDGNIFSGCNGEQLYGPNDTNTGTFTLNLNDSNGHNLNYPAVASDVWTSRTIPLTSAQINNTNFNINLIVAPLSLSSGSADCVYFDDFSLITSTATVSPALNYIGNMTTFTAFPYAIINATNGLSIPDIKVSTGFASVPLSQFTMIMSLTNQNPCTTGSTVYRLYKNDSTYLDVSDLVSKSDSYSSASCGYGCYIGTCVRTATMPIINYTYFSYMRINYGATISLINITSPLITRSIFANTLTGYETITGANDLYPVIIYNNQINGGTGAHEFSAYNFKPSESSTSNILFQRIDQYGTVQAVSGGTYTFPSGSSAWSYDWMGSPESSDTVKTTFSSNPANSYLSNTYTTFLISSVDTPTNCLSGCTGNDYYDRVWDGISCIESLPIINQPDCMAAAVVPVETLGDIDYSEPTITGLGLFAIAATPIAWFFGIMIGLSAFLAYKSGKTEIGIITALSLTILFASFGIFPLWIAIVLGLGFGLLLAAKMRGLIGGGGGG